MSHNSSSAKTYPWILHPLIDLLFVTGGGVILVVAIHYFVLKDVWQLDHSIAKQLPFLALVYLSQNVFASGHNVATYMRLWGSPQDRVQFKFYRTKLLLVLSILFLCGLFVPDLGCALDFLFLVTVAFHYSMQCFGLCLIYCLKSNYLMTTGEREVFRMMMHLLGVYGMVRFITLQDYCPDTFWGVAKPFWIPISGTAATSARHLCEVLLAVSCLLFCFNVLKKLLRQGRFLPLPVILLIGTMAALVCTTKPLNSVLWLYAPGLFHGSQYIALSLAYHLKEGLRTPGALAGEPRRFDFEPQDISKQLLRWPALKFLGSCVLIGSFLFIVIPHCCSLVGEDYTVIGGLVFSLLNFHQFVTDAAIWRLRDERLRRILTA